MTQATPPEHEGKKMPHHLNLAQIDLAQIDVAQARDGSQIQKGLLTGPDAGEKPGKTLCTEDSVHLTGKIRSRKDGTHSPHTTLKRARPSQKHSQHPPIGQPQEIPDDSSPPVLTVLQDTNLQAPTPLQPSTLKKAVASQAPQTPFTPSSKILALFKTVEGKLESVLGLAPPIEQYRVTLQAIQELEPQISSLTDEQLKAKTAEFRQRIKEGEALDQILPEAFAVVREVSRRMTGMRPFDVQILAGIALHHGKMIQMDTGEGKTLSATLPAYLNALSGNPVQIVTVNDTLARRDAAWMGPIYKFLGLDVGVVTEGMDQKQKQENYRKNILYLTNDALMFDYLRDQSAMGKEDQLQGGRDFLSHTFAIVDEVDEILIDEARIPFIISKEAQPAEERYNTFAAIAKELAPGEEYRFSPEEHTAWLTDAGLDRVEKILGKPLYRKENLFLLPYLHQALLAQTLYRRDQDYVVEDGKVKLVDEFTGRIAEGRRYNDGLHQAIEAKEGARVTPEQKTLASISYPNFFKLYAKLAGMSGTAIEAQDEFKTLYGKDVAIIPPNKPGGRKDLNDLIFLSREEKFLAVAKEVEKAYREGRPVLVGTRSVEDNEYLSTLLSDRGIPHQLLNAKSVKHNTEEENAIIARAGQSGMVTLATNMAGRGVDIKPDLVNLKKLWFYATQLAGKGRDVAVLLEERDLKTLKERLHLPPNASSVTLQGASHSHQKGKPGRIHLDIQTGYPDKNDEYVKRGFAVLDGSSFPTDGLLVLGTERHESRRIDDQLRGRSGRQGEPGTTRFYLSLEDDLIRHFMPDWMKKILPTLGYQKGEPLEHPLLSKAVSAAQGKVESSHLEMRKALARFDEVLDTHREIIYTDRQGILEGEDLSGEIPGWIKEQDPAFLLALLQIRDGTRSHLIRAALQRYRTVEKSYGKEKLNKIIQARLLPIIDENWSAHLQAMQELQEGNPLLSYGREDPMLRYKELAFQAFNGLKERIKQDLLLSILGSGRRARQ